jgi:tRNA pseudouridine65 synthase
MSEVIFIDNHFAAINKPHGMLTHPSSIAIDAGETAMQWLRDRLGRYVYTLHRLDRKTGGVLLFALDKETQGLVQRMFAENQVQKTYLAIVRGYTDDEGIIDHPIKGDDGKAREAVTHYRTLARNEISVPFGQHATSRYSLVAAEPKTGRMHQLRKHFSHILHPIIGDRPHGCNKQNRLFKERWELNTMLLHALRLVFEHPVSKERVDISAEPQPEFKRMQGVLGLMV